jgi:hypothetical protein
MGPKYVAKEITRRIAGKPYTYNGNAIVDVVKIDCEGCEWALLTLGCQEIRRAGEYAIEIHGPEPLLLRKLEKCGFHARRIGIFGPMVSIWHFKLL